MFNVGDDFCWYIFLSFGIGICIVVFVMDSNVFLEVLFSRLYWCR